MKFALFSNYLTQLEDTSSRIEITKILADLLKTTNQSEIKEVCYLLTGSIAPSYEGLVFNVAEKMLVRAIAQAYDLSVDAVTSEYKLKGDLGETALSLTDKKATNKQEYSMHQVFEHLVLVSQEEGEGSQEKRITLISDVLKGMKGIEAKYYLRIISGRLRLGFSDKTIIDALSWMETGGKEKSTVIGRAYEVVPDIGELASRIKEKGIDIATKHVTPVIGIPVMPMLCQRLKSPSDMVKKMGEVSVEPKFDGLRIVIHYSKKRKILKAFTRSLKEISDMFPELGAIAEHIHADEVILDTEAVGMDPVLMKIADFQTTMKRRRKHDVEDSRSKIPVTFQVFDMIFKDGVSLMDEPYVKRREIIEKTIKNGSLLRVDQFEITTDPAVITKLHHEYRGQGLEGIIVKKTDSTYVPGRLGWRWVKMKETEASTSGKLSDTVDGIIMGYSVGQGKRVGFGIGQFLVGVLDGDKIKTITKVGTGLTDQQFKELNTVLSSIKVSEKPDQYEVHKNLTPDFWVTPQVVVELAGDDITVSPNHTAGYALRFPRLVKIREDKGVSQSTTVKEVHQLFKLQSK